MENYIYLDKFRGFSNTFVPIKEINFLVGENSTGKTSVLSILKLLSMTSFWAYQDFNQRPVNLGSFDDILSRGEPKGSSISIGGYGLSEDGGWYNGFMIKFKAHDNLPKAIEYNYLGDGFETIIDLREKCIVYKTRKISNSIDSGYARGRFKAWRTRRKITGKFEKLEYREVGVDSVSRRLLGGCRITSQESAKMTDDSSQKDGVIIPVIFSHVGWVAPIRSIPKQTYEGVAPEYSVDGGHIPHYIRKYLGDKSVANKFRPEICKFGKDSGLFESVSVKNYGNGTASPFALRVELSGENFNISRVGYGVSQGLPVAVDMMARRVGSCVAIQQPEIHLHPKAQAAFGSLISALSKNEKKCFLIETHSDYLIDRFRFGLYKTKTKTKTKTSSQILFFQRKGQVNTVHPIVIDENGQLDRKQPSAYRSFFLREELKMLGIS